MLPQELSVRASVHSEPTMTEKIFFVIGYLAVGWIFTILAVTEA